jgi:hypothetical protein
LSLGIYRLGAFLLAASALTAGCELSEGNSDTAVASDVGSPLSGSKTAEQEFLENERERLARELRPEPTEPGIPSAGSTAPAHPVERVELVEAGQDAPWRNFTSVEGCDKAKATLAKHDEESCDPRAALCVPYQRTCVTLE